ncbi:MAG: hypothetical protein ACYDBB_02300 [Armatimonadota bacterium]
MFRISLIFLVIILTLGLASCGQQNKLINPSLADHTGNLAFLAKTNSTGRYWQAFLYSGTDTRCISLGNDGQPANNDVGNVKLSPDGFSVVFFSHATNLPQIAGKRTGSLNGYVYSVKEGNVKPLQSIYRTQKRELQENCDPLLFLSDGESYMALTSHVFQSKVKAMSTFVSIIKLSTDEVIWEKEVPFYVALKAISTDGSYIVYSGSKANALHLFTLNRSLGTSTIVDAMPNDYVRANVDDSFGGVAVSKDGRYVTYAINAKRSGIGNSKSYLFLNDLKSNTTNCISYAISNGEENGNSGERYVGINGNIIVFDSLATNLVNNDNNAGRDIFAYNINTKATKLISVNPDGKQFTKDSDCGAWGVSMDINTKIAFSASGKIYLYDYSLGKTTIYSINVK